MKTLKLARGEKLFYEGDESKHLYVLKSGMLLVFKGEIVIAELEPPGFIGELGCIMNIPRSTTVFAKTPAELTVQDGPELISKFKLQNGPAMDFLESMAKRLERTRAKVNEYQLRILLESQKILAVLIAEKEIADKDVNRSEARQIRQEAEKILQDAIKHEDAMEDHRRLSEMADKYRVKGQFQKVMSKQFRSFSPLDLKPFKIARFETYLNFKAAARDIAEKIVVLTRYLADFQTLELHPLDVTVAHLEKSLAFAAREKLLGELFAKMCDETAGGTAKQKLPDLGAAFTSFKADPGYMERSLFPIARCFDLDKAYVLYLQNIIKDYLTGQK